MWVDCGMWSVEVFYEPIECELQTQIPNTKCKCLCNASMRVCQALKGFSICQHYAPSACFIQFNTLYLVNEANLITISWVQNAIPAPSPAHCWPGAIKWHSLHCSLENICAYNYVCAVLQVTVHPSTCTTSPLHLSQSICSLHTQRFEAALCTRIAS